MINYDGRRFRKPDNPEAPVSTYRQQDDLVWAEFGPGADIRRGSLTGTCDEDGTVSFAYTMVMADGRVISGFSVNTPEYLPDGRIQLNERWERYGTNAASGLSVIVEVPD